jgi:hypothetical protein
MTKERITEYERNDEVKDFKVTSDNILLQGVEESDRDYMIRYIDQRIETKLREYEQRQAKQAFNSENARRFERDSRVSK